ncbi:Ig-like domain-containing protein [Rhodococcus sp. NPDC127528]|uniref:Ig-like domain-containing protein n=1 Tax=unclassified Rhodococcus (in: high G+C Gram-positive bacteria) TaxID=192944 RepID=UPI00363F611A
MTALTATGLLLLGNSVAAAAATSFNNACVAGSIIGPVYKPVPASVVVDAPASVTPGQQFTYRIQPGQESYPNSDSGATTVQLSRLKFDFDIPANATFDSASIVAGTGSGLDGVAPNVLRVNTVGTVDPAGTILRLSGNNEVIANSPTTSTNSDGGIVVPKTRNGPNNSTLFQLPAVDVTVTAGPSGVIEPHVRVAGDAALTNNDENYATSLASATFLGAKQWAPTRCSPKDGATIPAPTAPLNAGGGALATIAIGTAEKTDTTTTVTATPTTVDPDQDVTVHAVVSPAPTSGTVQFMDNGVALGSPVPVTGGAVSTTHAFTTPGAHNITAVYSGDDQHNGSTSSATTITVNGAPAGGSSGSASSSGSAGSSGLGSLANLLGS